MSLRGAGPGWLFCPADRPERFAKAAAAADVVILDLEDGVAQAEKSAARQALQATPLDPARTVVRINAAGTPEHAQDLEALAHTTYTTVMLPKTESAEQVRALAPRDVIALVETPRGVLFATEIAAADNTVAMMWGAEDLVATLGGSSSRRADGTYRDVARHVRSTVLLAASSFGRLALDAVHLDIRDIEGLQEEAIDAAAVGFDVTVCIHPSQVDLVRKAYRPSDEKLAWARRVLVAARGERGVFAFEGQMVDSPVLRHAEMMLRRAGESVPPAATTGP
ncbi:CoA ester lyase [Mycobacterium kubicae]|uniref:HpcH/HpaI aldolase/citrate lyase family protein n=1 Tax=Mycobacterium kubicae TaxID=120959 RepID=UPI0016412682|nr:CoA ester lyase [Mycobacterium kubicae]QNI07878.1 CoA ester lyase [Mycobacterium kubicae]